jgi:hypothetical protein
MTTTSNLPPQRTTKSSPRRGADTGRLTSRSRTRDGRRELPLRTAKPVPSGTPSVDRRPHGHVVGHAIGEQPPPSYDGRPHGHVVGHAIGEQPPVSYDGRPRGHVVGHAIGD